MTAKPIALGAFFAVIATAEPALAHHVMGGRMPASFADGLLSGLGHPVIGLDHFAAVVAVGCLAAAHRAGAALAIGFVVAMMAGVAMHLAGTTVPGAEIWVALSVIALGGVMLTQRQMSAVAALTLFAAAGLLHGYALGESIYGAERTPLYGLSHRPRRHSSRGGARRHADCAHGLGCARRNARAASDRRRHCRHRIGLLMQQIIPNV